MGFQWGQIPSQEKGPFLVGMPTEASRAVFLTSPRRWFCNRREWGQCVKRSREQRCWEKQGICAFESPLLVPRPWSLKLFLKLCWVTTEAVMAQGLHHPRPLALPALTATYFLNSLTWLLITHNPQRVQTGALWVLRRSQIIFGSHWRLPDKIWNTQLNLICG